MLWKNGWSAGSHHTKPPTSQGGCSPKNFSSNHPCGIKVRPPTSSFDLCLPFCISPSSMPSGLIWNDLSPCLMSARDVGVANTRHIRQNILPRARKVHSCIYKAWDDDSLIVPSSSCIVLFFPTHSCSLSFSFYLMASPESRFLNFSWGLKTWVELGLPHEKLFGIFRTSKTLV